MKIFKLTAAACAALLMGACSNSEDAPAVVNPQDNEAGDLYVQFRVNTAGLSRSSTQDDGTSTDGVEIAQDEEDVITNIEVFFCDPTTHTILSAAKTNSAGLNNGTYSSSFSGTDLSAYKGKTVEVLVRCNMTPLTTSERDAYSIDRTVAYSSDTQPWVDNHFYMSNAADLTVTMPTDFTAYNTADNALDLGTVKVERQCARIDLNNTELEWEIGEGDDLAKTEFVATALLNMSSNWYEVKRVSADGLASNVTYMGIETSNNFVVDTDAADKNAGITDQQNLANFTYPYQDRTTWEYTLLSSLSKDDNENSWNSASTYNKTYKIWRYCTENTISGSSNQIYNAATLVAYKSKIIAKSTESEDPVVAAMTAGKALYVYNNKMYGAWADLAKYVDPTDVDNYDADLAQAYALSYTDEDPENGEWNQALCIAAGFKIYAQNDDGNYYMLYYYGIRHNDNNLPTEMGPMEFCVVRNNVYKLLITSVSKFGEPEIKKDNNGNNPDEGGGGGGIPGDDPLEKDDVYFTVNVVKAPWTVRVNDIDF